MVVVSGDSAGWITPCGCTSNQSGGLLRRGSYLDGLRRGGAVIKQVVRAFGWARSPLKPAPVFANLRKPAYPAVWVFRGAMLHRRSPERSLSHMVVGSK